jgi:hypothetical protein
MEKLYDKLFSEGLISEDNFTRLKKRDSGLFSIGLELKSLLYAGVLMLSSGLGIAVYKNIDSIGHMVIITVIALISAGSFCYCFRVASPWSTEKVKSPNIFYDYVLLLAGLTLVSFLGYLQYQYSIFGNYNELVFLITALILFTAAYYFDHVGILSMAITSLTAYAGITVSPLNFFQVLQYALVPLIFTGIVLGIMLIASARFLSARKIKSHFTFTYHNFGVNILFIFSLTGLFNLNVFLFIFFVAAIGFLTLTYAFRVKSFYFLLITILYSYIGLTYLFLRLTSAMELDVARFYLIFFYFIATAIYMTQFLRNYRNKFQNDAGI